MIYCLMVSGTPLNDAMRTLLFTIAREMVRKGLRKRNFKESAHEGAVYTQGQHGSIGSVSGVHFTAVIESEQVSTKASFIVPTGDLPGVDQAKWVELFPDWGDQPSLN